MRGRTCCVWRPGSRRASGNDRLQPPCGGTHRRGSPRGSPTRECCSLTSARGFSARYRRPLGHCTYTWGGLFLASHRLLLANCPTSPPRGGRHTGVTVTGHMCLPVRVRGLALPSWHPSSRQHTRPPTVLAPPCERLSPEMAATGTSGHSQCSPSPPGDTLLNILVNRNSTCALTSFGSRWSG